MYKTENKQTYHILNVCVTHKCFTRRLARNSHLQIPRPQRVHALCISRLVLRKRSRVSAVLRNGHGQPDLTGQRPSPLALLYANWTDRSPGRTVAAA